MYKKDILMKCAQCPSKECNLAEKDCTGLKYEIHSKYSPDDLLMMKVTDKLTQKSYMEKTRVEELIDFAHAMKYNTLGLAFCVSMSKEAEILNRILSREFKVFSVVCKVCGIKKEKLVIGPNYKGDSKTSCNPLGQAEILNKNGTQLNIILGLCIGHDMLFVRYLKALVTTIAVKDRVLAHNPLGAFYSSFHRKARFELD